MKKKKNNNWKKIHECLNTSDNLSLLIEEEEEEKEEKETIIEVRVYSFSSC